MSEAAQPTGGMYRTAYSLYSIELASAGAQELEALLASKVDPNAQALRQLPITLDVSRIADLEDINFDLLKDICLKHGLFLIGLSGITSEAQAAVLHDKQIPIVNSNRFAKAREENLTPKIITKTVEIKVPVEVQVPVEVKVPVEVERTAPLQIITRTVRSGETISAPGNSVAIFGSVGMGARIIAAHHIFIFGDINQGELYAGSPKDQNDLGCPQAIIYVQGRFDPSLVAIAGNYQTAEDMSSDPLMGPLKSERDNVVVSLINKTLVYAKEKEFKLHTKKQ